MSAYTDALNLQRQAQTFSREQWAHETNISNTAHQREVADLKKAGLNPVLSSGGTGASYSSTSGDSGVSASAGVISADYSAKAALKASAQQAAATRYAAAQAASATRAAAAAQIKAAQIAASQNKYNTDAQVKLERDSWKSKPQTSPFGLADKYATKLADSLGVSTKKLVNDPFNVMKTSFKKLSLGYRAVNAVKSNNYYNSFNTVGKVGITTALRAMNVKVNKANQNLFAKFIVTGSRKYYNQLLKLAR